MAINFKDIINILTSNNRKRNILSRIVLDYGILKQKSDNPEEQSWYFNNALESNQYKMLLLKKEFDEIRKEINDLTIDDLLAYQNKAKENKERVLLKGYMNTLDQMCFSGIQSKISYYQDLIEVKSRVEEVKSIDYYVENGDELLKLYWVGEFICKWPALISCCNPTGLRCRQSF